MTVLTLDMIRRAADLFRDLPPPVELYSSLLFPAAKAIRFNRANGAPAYIAHPALWRTTFTRHAGPDAPQDSAINGLDVGLTLQGIPVLDLDADPVLCRAVMLDLAGPTWTHKPDPDPRAEHYRRPLRFLPD